MAKQKLSVILALIMLLGSVLNPVAAWAGAAVSADWNSVSPLPSGNDLSGIIYGNGKYIAVGNSGTILTSVNGNDGWESHDSGTANLNGVAAGVDGNGNALFAVVGNGGTILTSPDGETWTPAVSGTTADLKGITYGSGLFAAVGNNGTILISPDGEAWTPATSGTAEALYGITSGLDNYGNTLYVAVGNGGTILTSPDGEAWTSATSGSTEVLYGVTRGLDSIGNSLFVAVGSNGTILTSPDGTDWTPAISGSTSALYGINYSGGQLVAVGAGGTILVSTDGATWSSQSYSTPNSLQGVAGGNNYYVAVGQSGTMLYTQFKPAAGAATITSVKDVDSLGNTSKIEVRFNKAADESRVSEYRVMLVGTDEALEFNVVKANSWTPDSYTTVGKTGSNLTVTLDNIENDSAFNVFVLSVADGVNATENTLSEASAGITPRMWEWANPKPAGDTFNATAFGDNTYVAVGENGIIYTSNDGANWTNRTFEADYHLNSVAYGKGRFVAVGDFGRAVTSPDGIHWTFNDNVSDIPDYFGDLTGVAYGKGLFVAIRDDGILTSSDGVTWILRNSETNLRAVTYGNGKFVAVGYNQKILYSPDGKTWATATNSDAPEDYENLYGVTYGSSGFVAGGTNGKVLTSADGISWVSTPIIFDYFGTPTTFSDLIKAVTYGDGQYLALSAGTILTSVDGSAWSVDLNGVNANINDLVYANSRFVAVGDSGLFTSADGTDKSFIGTAKLFE